jgi:hypothetical protein
MSVDVKDLKYIDHLLTPEQRELLGGKGSKPSKYRNVRTEYRGVLYDSKAEARRAEVLDLMHRAGEIEYVVRQPKFRLGVKQCVYVADFAVCTRHGGWIEDIKGQWTAKFKRDVKLWEEFGPCELRIIDGRGVTQVIRGGRKTLEYV